MDTEILTVFIPANSDGGNLSMTRNKIAITVFVAMGLGLLLWRPSAYDRAQVLPAVRDLPRPFQKVSAEWYLDGGSIGLEITDATGQITKLAIPVGSEPGDSRRYHRLFLGALYAKHSNAVEVAFSRDTRRYLTEILQKEASGADRDMALICLRGSFRDYFEVFGRIAYRRLRDF
ncbi:MAG: hypothetical protein JNL10_12665 [Verrucomicrobiales bacterium]|nr:hypothetical protein [Verrucomicrobiales bacterium]